jgi:hypothetical protein
MRHIRGSVGHRRLCGTLRKASIFCWPPFASRPVCELSNRMMRRGAHRWFGHAASRMCVRAKSLSSPDRPFGRQRDVFYLRGALRSMEPSSSVSTYVRLLIAPPDSVGERRRMPESGPDLSNTSDHLPMCTSRWVRSLRTPRSRAASRTVSKVSGLSGVKTGLRRLMPRAFCPGDHPSHAVRRRHRCPSKTAHVRGRPGSRFPPLNPTSAPTERSTLTTPAY